MFDQKIYGICGMHEICVCVSVCVCVCFCVCVYSAAAIENSSENSSAN